MGYRSDVRIITSKKGYKELKEYVDNRAKECVKVRESKEYDWNLLNRLNVKKENNFEVLIGWNNIKWYTNWDEYYEDVTIIEQGLDYINELGYGFRFSRIGEDYTDIEEICQDGTLEDEDALDYVYITRMFDDDEFLDTSNQDEEE